MATQHYIGYDNAVTTGNISAGSEQTGYPATEMAKPATHLVWKSDDASSAQYVTIDINAVQDADYIGIAAHNLGSTGCDVEIEGQTTDGGAWSSIVSEFSPSDDKPILKTFTSDDYYGVRIKITPGGSVKPQIAVVYVGEITQLESDTYVGHTPLSYGRNVDTVSRFSDSKQFLGRVIRGTEYSGEISVVNMTPAWYRATFEGFVAEAETKPFFYAWRLTDYPNEIAYCWVSGGVPVPENTGPAGLMAVRFSVKGLA